MASRPMQSFYFYSCLCTAFHKFLPLFFILSLPAAAAAFTITASLPTYVGRYLYLEVYQQPTWQQHDEDQACLQGGPILVRG
mmetsp:Transcript_7516/g.14873  ORF Transcript_7516/g.14873 Transcript_7516/m.14873 type:complete len:82 (+) Transcript_7516:391-636(+)